MNAPSIDADAALGLGFLARAGEALMDELDARVRLGRLGRILVPDFGDIACLYLTGDHGEIELVEAAAVDPAHATLMRARAARRGALPDALGRVAQAIRSGQAELLTEVRDADLGTASSDADDIAALRGLGMRSWLCVPLVKRGRSLGAIVITRLSPRSFGQAHLDVARELAHRAAVAVENVRLFELAQRERCRAEEAGRLKDEFLANLGHELRTPLTAILGWTRILRTRTVPEDKRARALEAIERNALAQARLVEDLLDVSRILARKLALELAPVDLALVLEAALAAARPAAEAKGLRIRSVIDAEAGRLCGDAARLRQAVDNVLSNAVKFTPASGSIEVRLERDGASAQVVVADTGQGIRADFLPHVFERFRQADGSLTRAHGGLGVGLAIAQSLVELHGGTLDADSAGEGHGATFTLHLPLAP